MNCGMAKKVANQKIQKTTAAVGDDSNRKFGIGYMIEDILKLIAAVSRQTSRQSTHQPLNLTLLDRLLELPMAQ